MISTHGDRGQGQNAIARHSSTSTHDGEDATWIHLAQSCRSESKGKTLFEMAEERQAKKRTAELPETTYNDHSLPQDMVLQENALLTALLYGLTLTMVHFTFDVLVYHQYAQEIKWPEITSRIPSLLVLFCVIVFTTHINPIARYARLRQCMFFTVSSVVGCYLVRITNQEPYIAVMKSAPPLGSFWLWAVMEMRWGVSMGSLGVVGIYLWWSGFSIV